MGFGGGFHLLLETHRKRGSLFGRSHLEDIFSTWRKTPGQLKWVLEPGDPGQVDEELIMVVLALYTTAVREEAKRQAKKAHENGNTHFKMCAADIIDSMTKRALLKLQKSSFCFVHSHGQLQPKMGGNGKLTSSYFHLNFLS